MWRLAKDAELVNYKNSPWRVLLTHYGVWQQPGLRQGLRPCCWRRPPTGACADDLLRGARWDWRSCRLERKVRLAMQNRYLAPTTDRLARGDSHCAGRRGASAGDIDSDPDSAENDAAKPFEAID